MTLALEARPYGPESTPVEIDAIKGHVYRYRDGIVMWREVPIMSEFQVELFGQRLSELGAELQSYRLLVDLTELKQAPNAELRGKLRSVFKAQSNLRACAVFTGKNFMLNIAAKFVLGGVGVPFSVHQTKEEALKALGHDS